MPEWVRFLIGLGYEWPRSSPRPRRIALISMPCDSVGAGLISLGAMIRDLGSPNANDVDGHYEKLLRYARQYLESCARCDMVCNTSLKRCGYTKQATGRLRSPRLPHSTVTISDLTDFEAKQIKWIQRDGRKNQVVMSPTPQHAVHYHIEGDPPVVEIQPQGELSIAPYQNLVNGAPVFSENTRKSYSGLCFVGRAGGETISRELCASTRFRNGTGEYGLDELLTISGWAESVVSRIAFFNPRSEKLDRSIADINLVVADGDASFLKVCDRPEFRSSDIIGVIHRNVDRDALEAVGEKMLPNQWFISDTDKLCELPPLPTGISVAILKERKP